MVAVAVDNLNTLIDYRFRQHFKAQNGRGGMGKNRTGADGQPVVLKVPTGTLILAEDNETVLAELMTPGERIVISHGGKGGHGNAHFKGVNIGDLVREVRVLDRRGDLRTLPADD